MSETERHDKSHELSLGITEPVSEVRLAVHTARATRRPPVVVCGCTFPIIHPELDPSIASDAHHDLHEIGLAWDSRHPRVRPCVIDPSGNLGHIDHERLRTDRDERRFITIGKLARREPVRLAIVDVPAKAVGLAIAAPKRHELVDHLDLVAAVVHVVVDDAEGVQLDSRRPTAVARIDRNDVHHGDQVIEAVVGHELRRLVLWCDRLLGEECAVFRVGTLRCHWTVRRYRLLRAGLREHLRMCRRKNDSENDRHHNQSGTGTAPLLLLNHGTSGFQLVVKGQNATSKSRAITWK